MSAKRNVKGVALLAMAVVSVLAVAAQATPLEPAAAAQATPPETAAAAEATPTETEAAAQATPIETAACEPVICPAIVKLCPQGQVGCRVSPCNCAQACVPEGQCNN
jgi:hypothetical protein